MATASRPSAFALPIRVTGVRRWTYRLLRRFSTVPTQSALTMAVGSQGGLRRKKITEHGPGHRKNNKGTKSHSSTLSWSADKRRGRGRKYLGKDLLPHSISSFTEINGFSGLAPFRSLISLWIDAPISSSSSSSFLSSDKSRP